MERYTITQRAKIVIIYLENNRSIIQTQREYRRIFNVATAPTAPTIRSLFKNFEQRGTVADVKRIGRSPISRSNENIARVAASVEEQPETSTRRRASQLQLSRRTLQRILHTDLHLYPYKIQLVQQLHPGDKQLRLEYSRALLNIAENDVEFHCKLMMSDEAHFHLNGFVNKQNCRFWGSNNPRQLHQKSLHPIRVTVWCAIKAERIIGPYFYEDDHGAAVTVDGEHYRAMIQNFLVPQLQEEDQQIWFQQDGATAHTARATMRLLREYFPDRIISKNGDLRWPPRSPDLTAPDFFLWGYLKEKVYVNKPRTLQELKNNIRDEIAAITPETLNNVMKNVIKRAHFCQQAGGGHLANLIFQT